MTTTQSLADMREEVRGLAAQTRDMTAVVQGLSWNDTDEELLLVVQLDRLVQWFRTGRSGAEATHHRSRPAHADCDRRGPS